MSILWRILPIGYQREGVDKQIQPPSPEPTPLPTKLPQERRLTSPKNALRSSSSLTYCTPTSRSVINTGGGGCFLLSFFEFVNFGCGGGWSDLVGMLNETG